MTDRVNLVDMLLDWKETSQKILEHSLETPTDGSIGVNVTDEVTQETISQPFEGDFAKGFIAATLLAISLLEQFPIQVKESSDEDLG